MPARRQCISLGPVEPPPTGRPAAGAPASGLAVHLALDGDGRDEVSGQVAVIGGASPTSDRLGRAGGALQLSGSGSFSLQGLSRLPQGSAPRTAAVWIKTGQGADWRSILSFGQTARGRTFGLALLGAVGSIMCFYADVNGQRQVTDDRWHHLAGTYDGTVARLYVDGELDAVGPLSLATAGQSLWIGSTLPDHPSRYYYRGALDDLRIYDRALDDGEVRTLAQGTGQRQPVGLRLDGASCTWNNSLASLTAAGGATLAVGSQHGGHAGLRLPQEYWGRQVSVSFEVEVLRGTARAGIDRFGDRLVAQSAAVTAPFRGSLTVGGEVPGDAMGIAVVALEPFSEVRILSVTIR